MLNIEKYEKEIIDIGLNSFGCTKDKEIKRCGHINCCDCIFCDNRRCSSRKTIEWLASEYKEPILTEEEKEYLKNLIKHFRNYIKYIERETEDFYNGEQLESINIWMKKGDIGNFTIIPIVETSLTFEGMEDERQYSLEELGL